MIKFITNILLSIPIKIWFILGYLIHTGIKALKPQTMWFPKLFIFPCVIILLSIIGLARHMEHNPSTEIWNIYILSCISGTIFGLFIYRDIHLIVDKSKWLITLPGGYTTLILFILIFLLSYFWGYMEASNTYFFSPKLIHWEIASSGILLGVSVGRTASFIYKFYKQ